MHVKQLLNPPANKSPALMALWLLSPIAILFVLGLFGWIISGLISISWNTISWDFLTSSPTESITQAAIAPMLVSSFWIVALSVIIFCPIGIGAAVLLSEELPITTRTGRILRQVLNVLAGVPSIVFGLFGNAFFCITLGLGFSILAGALTLACMVLPYFIRTVEAGLSAVPKSSRRNALALGFTKFGTVWHVLLPAAFPAILLGIVLGIARAASETAALIFTSGYSDRMPESWLDSGSALTVHIYKLAEINGSEHIAGAAALTLLGLLLIINLIAFILPRLLLTNQKYRDVD